MTTPEALHEHAVAALQGGRPDEAVALLEQARAAGLDDPAIDATLGLALHHLGRLDDAAAAHRRAIAAARAQLAATCYNLGTVLVTAGRLDDAAAAFDDALAARPDFALAHNNLGMVRQRQGRLADAERSYRAALAAAPDDPTVHHNLASARCALGDLDGAAAGFGAALDLDPGFARAACGLGAVLTRLGRRDDAIAACRRALALEPDLAEAHRHLATALVDADPAAALAAATRAVELAPDEPDGHETLAAARVAGGDLAGAIDAFGRAAALAPDRALPCYNAGVLLDRCGRFEEAIAALEVALARAPSHDDALVALAGAQHHLGRRDDAIATWRRVLARRPDDPGARHMLAALTGASRHAPPPGYVAAMFDAYAPRFDDHLVGTLAYRGPALLRDAVAAGAPYPRAVDLGCGTGLCGEAVAPLCGTLDGVDLSPAMVARAVARGVYARVDVGDVVAWLAGATDAAPYDVAIAGDVLIYLGDLAPLFAALRPRLRAGATFAFTVERADDAPAGGDAATDHELRPTGRWRHAPGYLRRLAAAHGFVVEAMTPAELRREHHDEVAGLIVVLRAA